MKKFFKKLSKEFQNLIYSAGKLADKNNSPVYLVGGFVRDLILREDNLDLDMVVEGDGIKFAEDFANLLKVRLIIHRRFGTATMVLRHNLKIDIATARSESYPEPAGLPIVTKGSLRDDLKRRDFTINAMAISISKGNFGRLIDFFCSRDDLRNRKIRILHNLSFIDDPTRILRAIRFEKRYNFRIESGTLKALREAVKLKMLEKVQPQRLRDELILILKEASVIRQIIRIRDLAGLDFINPHLSLNKITYRLLMSIKHQIKWFKKRYPQRRRLDTWLIYLMGLINYLSLNDTKEICKRFVFSSGEAKRILDAKKINRKFILALSQDIIKPNRIFSLLEPLSYEVIIFIKAKYKNQNLQRHIEVFFETYHGMRLFVSGSDLQGLGIMPGPNYKKIFTQVLKAKLKGNVRTKEEELALVKNLINK